MKDYVKTAMSLKSNFTFYLNVVCIMILDCNIWIVIFYINPNHLKLKQLFQSTHEKQVTDIAIFIQKAFTLRNAWCY